MNATSFLVSPNCRDFYFVELSPMSRLRLLMVCMLSTLCYSAWADGLRTRDGRIDEHVDEPVRHQEKFAGRASTLTAANDPQSKIQNPQGSARIQDAHEKKSLSKEEKRALRRQINETENKYPRRN